MFFKHSTEVVWLDRLFYRPYSALTYVYVGTGTLPYVTTSVAESKHFDPSPTMTYQVTSIENGMAPYRTDQFL